jgi:hypothetical protein
MATKTTLQHGVPVKTVSLQCKHIVITLIRTKVWNFRIFEVKYLANHLSPTQYFDGSELPTSWRTQAYQNFENRSDYHILQFSQDELA